MLPYFRRIPGSRWALETAKYNLVHNYLVVGLTEELGDFIAVLEAALPRFFAGATDLYNNGEKVLDQIFHHLHPPACFHFLFSSSLLQATSRIYVKPSTKFLSLKKPWLRSRSQSTGKWSTSFTNLPKNNFILSKSDHCRLWTARFRNASCSSCMKKSDQSESESETITTILLIACLLFMISICELSGSSCCRHT